MKSEEISEYEIQDSTEPLYYTSQIAVWLKEIAYQLARMNERFDNREVDITVHQP